MAFTISTERISPIAERPSPTTGAVVVFEGVVRDNNEGNQVLSLEYEAMDSLACKEGNRILEEAMKRFPIESAECIHRVGHLKIGDIAVRVVVAAGHRKEAFAACSYIIDEVKSRVPIWKKEHYADGSSDWIGAACESKNPIPNT